MRGEYLLSFEYNKKYLSLIGFSTDGMLRLLDPVSGIVYNLLFQEIKKPDDFCLYLVDTNTNSI